MAVTARSESPERDSSVNKASQKPDGTSRMTWNTNRVGNPLLLSLPRARLLAPATPLRPAMPRCHFDRRWAATVHARRAPPIPPHRARCLFVLVDAALAAIPAAGAASRSAWKSNNQRLCWCMADAMVVLFTAHAPLPSRSQLLASHNEDSRLIATRCKLRE